MNKFKITLGRTKAGWMSVDIENPQNKKRNVKIAHSGVFPFFQELIDILESLKYKKKAKLEIQEEGPETHITFLNLGTTMRVTFEKAYCSESYRKNYRLYFKKFTTIHSKKQFTRHFKKTLWKHYLQNKKEYFHEYYEYSFDVMSLRKL